MTLSVSWKNLRRFIKRDEPHEAPCPHHPCAHYEPERIPFIASTENTRMLRPPKIIDAKAVCPQKQVNEQFPVFQSVFDSENHVLYHFLPLAIIILDL